MTEFTDETMPGDIIVTSIHSGFLIGRAMPEDGPGPWWQYIQTVADEAEAFALSRRLADLAHVRAWLHVEGNQYREIL